MARNLNPNLPRKQKALFVNFSSSCSSTSKLIQRLSFLALCWITQGPAPFHTPPRNAGQHKTSVFLNTHWAYKKVREIPGARNRNGCSKTRGIRMLVPWLPERQGVKSWLFKPDSSKSSISRASTCNNYNKIHTGKGRSKLPWLVLWVKKKRSPPRIHSWADST